MADQIDILEGQPCPMCSKKTLTLREITREIPYFGMSFVFSMDCSECDYHMADVELESDGKAIKQTIEIESEEDLNIRVIKSSTATIKIPRLVEITPGPISNGYITNVEGILNRIKKIIESKRDDEDKSIRKKAKNQLKKIQKVIWGREKITLTITDPKGNSAIVSDKVKK
ncbi:ZPR1 zinc finger domain-containing protein [archaeon]|jgi:zinc finger protein|nr:ZPR1 zinc finger domain-containing protein [archaeon]MBT4021956.1 ZPR1 zinc finger domain-containing protein [archaeon]MBT4272273.1 ZPR1 zinc finger domain-containing protein [archaeon]MBT4460809.1 ZPR1 zinc finger domain-containing protein [archaeon]MBT4858377.1 ZPR1 zinc finger domain-containing protein [archaeon]